jgi:formylglycine-generating enzyme required for sulfatase activity
VILTRPFYIGKYEVTQEQWEKVMGENYSHFEGAKNPVEMVCWDDCQEFLKKLNDMGKEQGEFRLPTEAEWEWACRAGTKTRFCSDDADATLADYGWFDANSGETTHPVGKKRSNAWGLYDMHGNVWEWCGDWYAAYAKGWRPQVDPTGPATGSDRVLRGGSWDYLPRDCRSSNRDMSPPSYGSSCFNGFRVVAVKASRCAVPRRDDPAGGSPASAGGKPAE